MAENFELLETNQLELLHQSVHNRTNDNPGECHKLRAQHDSIASELVKRGVFHDTEIVCDEVETNAPNYQRSFTDDMCVTCAFGQLNPYCNLYKFDYINDYVCDSFRYFEVLELEPPHGFLMAKGKQTAIASKTPQMDKKPRLIVSGGEAFGIAILDEPAQVKTKEFDSDSWQKQHKITPRERRQFWPDEDIFFVYRLKEWIPFDGIKLWLDNQVIDIPRLTSDQWKLVSKSKELPKTITLIDNAVSVTEKQEFVIDDSVKGEALKSALVATYETDVTLAKSANELIDIYSLALVRKPQIRVSKKNFIAQEAQKTDEIIEIRDGVKMPFAVVRRDSEYCVINTDTEEVMGCHSTEDEADDQLVALNINVEEEENSSDKPKPKPKKPRKKAQGAEKETQEKSGFLERLKAIGDSITEFLATTPEPQETDDLALTGEVGIAQKTVNGELWHFCYSTNAFEDREGEIFSTKSLEDYVANNELNDDKGYFNLWHINAEDGNFNTDFAKKKWQGVVGRFLVEAGPYLRDERGRAARKFFKRFANGHPEIAPEGWGCSPEFKYLPEERVTGIYKNIWITRTSTLPRMAAANIWTETRQLKHSRGDKMALSENQLNSAIQIFGQEFVDTMISESETKTQELESAGVAHKAADEPQEINFTEEQFSILAAQIAKQFNINAFTDALNILADSVKNLKEDVDTLKARDSAKAKAEIPAFTFSLQRASDSNSSVVTDDDALKAKKPEEIVQPIDPATITPDQFFGKV